MAETAIDARNSNLLAWYKASARDLPWRTGRDPYRILVSEVMSQQTQMSRVVPRFERFIDRWPTEHDLAGASNTEVLAEWSGLGYNSRAIRLRDAAMVVSDNGWPRSSAELQSLPGVGPYTANAIAAIAFGERVAAIDTNLRRVISRWDGRPLAGSLLNDVAATLVPNEAGDWNQAIMDLGAGLCRPADPLCDLCPVTDHCADPDIYVRPAGQKPFEGSARQLRGALVRAHVEDRELHQAGEAIGRSPDEIAATIKQLQAEGLLPSSAEDRGQRTED